MSAISLDRHIEVTAETRGGQPRIAGRRITVADVAYWHEQQGRSADEICADYDLSLAQVHAALAYYFDHRTAIDGQHREAETVVADMRAAAPSLLAQRLKSNSSG